MTYGLPVMVHVVFPASVPETLVEANAVPGKKARKNGKKITAKGMNFFMMPLP
jgi:hypothetical protein